MSLLNIFKPCFTFLWLFSPPISALDIQPLSWSFCLIQGFIVVEATTISVTQAMGLEPGHGP